MHFLHTIALMDYYILLKKMRTISSNKSWKEVGVSG